MARKTRQQSGTFRTIDGWQTSIGQIKGGWAYELKVELQNGRWVIAQLRVFPESDEFKQDRLIRQLKYHMKHGAADAAANSAHQLAHFSRQGIRPPKVPPGGLTTRHLRQISFGKGSIIENLRELDAIALKLKSGIMRRREAEKKYQSLTREFRALTGDVRLTWIAHCYVEAQKRGSRRQNVEVAEQLRLSTAQVRDAILWARRKDLLSSTRQQGVSGGELTPKAIALLDSLRNVLATPKLAAVLNEGAGQLAVWFSEDEASQTRRGAK